MNQKKSETIVSQAGPGKAKMQTSYDKELQGLLEQSNGKYKDIFEKAGVGTAIVDLRGNFIRVNKVFAELFDCSCEEFIKLNLMNISHPSEIENSIQLIKNLVQDPEIKFKQIEKKYVKKSNEMFWGLLTVAPVRDSSDKITYFIAQLQDITSRKAAESKLAKFANELKEINIAKDKFFSIISHDLRSPFNALLGIAEYTVQFFDDLSKEEVKEAIKNVHKSSKKVYNLMQNLLEWTQVQTGRLNVEKSKVNLLEIANSVFSLYSESAVKKNIALHNNGEDSINLFADRYMIETILRNLISNGIKFTRPGGSVTLDADLKKDFVEITVTDTGTGIDPKDQRKLFRIDAKYRTTGTANEKGTGLGLILCKEFVEKNGGTILLESELDRGTKFIFTVPSYQDIIE